MEMEMITEIMEIYFFKYSMERLKERFQNSQLHQPSPPNPPKPGTLHKHGEIIILRNKHGERGSLEYSFV